MGYSMDALSIVNLIALAKFDRERIEAFIARWSQLPGGDEEANSEPFFRELFELLGEEPNFNAEGEVSFGKQVALPGEPDARQIDVYKRGTFIIQAIQGSNAADAKAGDGRRGSHAYQDAIREAFSQGVKCAQQLPEGLPPVLMVVDIGYRFYVWNSFGGSFGGSDEHGSILLDDLLDSKNFHLLFYLLIAPHRLDPRKVSGLIYDEPAGYLGDREG